MSLIIWQYFELPLTFHCIIISRGWYKANVGISSYPSGIRCSRVYRNFFILLVMGFFLKKKTHHGQFSFLKIQGIWKTFFFLNRLNHFFIKAIGLHLVSQFQNGITLGYWKYFWTYFLKKYLKNILKNIFEKNIYKKYFQYPSVIPFWNRETECNLMSNGFDRKMIWGDFLKKSFSNPL